MKNKNILFFSLIFTIQSMLLGDVLFTDITNESGISFSGMSEGVCVFDYNNDDFDDILFTTRNGSSLHLYRNQGDMIFSDVSFESNIGMMMEARTAVAGDYDNDGDLDIFVGATLGSSVFFQNNGDGTFQDITTLVGINVQDQVRGCSWVDYNNDGFLDLYVGLLYPSNKLFKNNGDNTFIEVAQNIGAAGPLAAGIIMGLGFIDYDRDGDQDLFITQDNNNGNILLRNDNGFFSDISAISNTNLEVMGMGVAFGDINRDGLFDFYTTNLYENSLMLNSEEGVFLDISASSRTEDIPGSMGWGTFFFDVNNDGWVDLYNNNETAFGGVFNSILINGGDSTFNMLGQESGAVINNNGYGSAFSDFDQDGDLDMVLVGHSSSVGSINLLRNDSDQNNWVIFSLRQPNYNVFSIGSTIELHHEGISQLNFISAGNGYCSQNTLDVHFGMANITTIDSVVIYWPDGYREIFMQSEINKKNYLSRGFGIATTTLKIDKPVIDNFTFNSIYPNPFNNSTIINILSNSDDPIRLNIYDIRGNLVKTIKKDDIKKDNNLIVLDLKGKSSGNYVISILSKNNSISKTVTFLK
ncbi:MAG: hypothetical protein CMG04_05620 [Candidatus Marinimicrobia bacterium]|nr:hypothetical protein [Candidatus Neomarinimicrobiota bacterium]